MEVAFKCSFEDEKYNQSAFSFIIINHFLESNNITKQKEHEEKTDQNSYHAKKQHHPPYP